MIFIEQKAIYYRETYQTALSNTRFVYDEDYFGNIDEEEGKGSKL